MSRVMVVHLSDDAHDHLIEAVAYYVRQSRRIGQRVPDDLVDLGRQLRARAGQGGTCPSLSMPVREVGGMSPRLVTIDGAAHLLGCSDRTIKRLISAGELKSLKIGGATRIRVAEIDAFIAGRARAAGEPRPEGA